MKFFALIGVLGLVFACNAALWWIAHQEAWWAYASLVTAGGVAYTVGAEAIKAIRQARNN